MVGEIQKACNDTVHSATGLAPNQIKLAYKNKDVDREHWTSTCQLVTRNLTKSADAMKYHADKTHCNVDLFKACDLVYV
jgi:hypothetical protein